MTAELQFSAATKPSRRHLLRALGAAGLLTIGLPLSTFAADPKPAKVVYKDMKWDALMPSDWDPTKRFKNFDTSKLQDGTPESDRFYRQVRETWDNAPTRSDLNGAAIRLPGYIVPLEESKGRISEFLLVPYFGACIHSPPPPANQIIHVLPASAAKGIRSMDPVWISGTLVREKTDSYMGAAGYRMRAERVEPYVERAK